MRFAAYWRAGNRPCLSGLGSGGNSSSSTATASPAPRHSRSYSLSGKRTNRLPSTSILCNPIMVVPLLIVETVTMPHAFDNHLVALHAKLEAVVARADSVAPGEFTP